MSVRRGDEDFETERRQSLVDEDRAEHQTCEYCGGPHDGRTTLCTDDLEDDL